MGAGLVLGITSFIGAVFSSVTTGIGWTVLHGSDVCTTTMHTYIEAVTIVATISLAIYGLGFLISLTSRFGETMATIAFVYNAGAIYFLSVVGGLLHVAWFIWGIVVLANHECEGTAYNTMTIVFVVLSGLSVIGSICHSRNNRESHV